MASRDALPKRRPTIIEVAKLAGVSHQTVSRYLRFGGEGLKLKTRERVEQAIRELDYRPNLLARSMRTRRTNRLAVVLPMADFVPVRMLAGAASAAHERGYMLEVVSLEGDAAARHRRVLELLDSAQLDGVLSLTPLGPDFEPRDVGGPPLVIAGDYDDKMHGQGALADASPVRDIIEHLVTLGHTTFLHVAGSQLWASARNRRRVYLETIEQLGLTSRGVVVGDWSARSGYDAVHALPDDSDVTAVLAANDIIAMGALRAAHERGWRVPEDLSVVGWDDEEFARYISPTLSTVSVDRETQGRLAIGRLLTAVEHEERPVLEVPLNRFVPRESIGRPSLTRRVSGSRAAPAASASTVPAVEATR